MEMPKTPLIVFGKQLKPLPGAKEQYLAPHTKLQVAAGYARSAGQPSIHKGYYETFKGDKIYKEDFKGVYVAGSASPLIWDFDNLVHHARTAIEG